MRRGALSLTLATALLLPTACFTGVESTPKITARDVKRENVTVTAEDTFLLTVADAPLREWQPGKRFRVTDPKISLVFGATMPEGEELAGRDITFEGVAEVPSITGGTDTQLTFRSPRGATLVYREQRALSRLMEKQSMSVPFTIQETMVEEARRLLTGKRLYILTSLWRDDADQPVDGRKFVPVTIDSVGYGTSFYPVKIALTDERGVSARVFLYPGAQSSTPRTFPGLFAFSDPRSRYPDISPEMWACIIDSRIAPGMTRDEARLALGVPKEVERQPTPTLLREMWVYDNGIYLLFEDGLLKAYRR